MHGFFDTVIKLGYTLVDERRPEEKVHPHATKIVNQTGLRAGDIFGQMRSKINPSGIA